MDVQTRLAADTRKYRPVLYGSVKTLSCATIENTTSLPAILVGAVITSQTLVAAVVGSIREYATLNALGVGVNALRKVVMEQAFWVGALGLLGSSVLAGLFFALAAHYNVPVQLSPVAALACLCLSMLLALVSGLAAIRTLRHADPASLLR